MGRDRIPFPSVLCSLTLLLRDFKEKKNLSRMNPTAHYPLHFDIITGGFLFLKKNRSEMNPVPLFLCTLTHLQWDFKDKNERSRLNPIHHSPLHFDTVTEEF